MGSTHVPSWYTIHLTLLQVYSARFESCAKNYAFHFWQTPDPTAAAAAAVAPTATGGLPMSLAKAATKPASLRAEVSHYGCVPYQALTEGYFVEPAAVKALLALYQVSHKGAAPYSRTMLEAQACHLSTQVWMRACTPCMHDGGVYPGA